MKKNVDAKAVVAKVRQKPSKRKVSFTFDKNLFDEFQFACEEEDVAVSPVLEELMRQFLTDRKKT